jgi:hypothetical protein
MSDRKPKFSNSLRRYNYTSNMLIKSENYLFDDIRKGLIHTGNLDEDIAQSVSSIRELRDRYQQRGARFSSLDD